MLAVGKRTVAAILGVMGVFEAPPAFLLQHVKGTKAEKTVEMLDIRRLMAGKVLALLVLHEFEMFTHDFDLR